MSLVSPGPLGSKKDILYMFVSINKQPLADFQNRVGNIKEVALREAENFKKGRFVLDGSSYASLVTAERATTALSERMTASHTLSSWWSQSLATTANKDKWHSTN